MNLLIEWILATAGAVLCIGGAIDVWAMQATMLPPGVLMWPMPALVLIETALLGLLGFAGVVLDREPSRPHWGVLAWIACGALAAMGIFGTFTVSAIALLIVPALIFGVAAILSNARRRRQVLPDLGVLAASAVANLALLFLFIAVAAA